MQQNNNQMHYWKFAQRHMLHIVQAEKNQK